MNLDREEEPFRGPSYKQAWEDSTKVIRDLYQLLEKEVINEADINAFQALRSIIRAYNKLVEQLQLQANIHLRITEEYNRLKHEIESSTLVHLLLFAFTNATSTVNILNSIYC